MEIAKIATLLCTVLCPAVCLGQGIEPGSVYAWGLNSARQCDVPMPNAGFTSVAASMHSLAIKGPPPSFAYQGILVPEGIPVYGLYDFEFRLYAVLSGGSQLAQTT